MLRSVFLPVVLVVEFNFFVPLLVADLTVVEPESVVVVEVAPFVVLK